MTSTKTILGIAFITTISLVPARVAAQCVDSFNLGEGAALKFLPLQEVFPMGTGTGLSALVATINTVNTAFLGSNSALASESAGTDQNRFGGGGWARFVSGESTTKTDSTGVLENTSTLIGSNGQPFQGKQTCHTITKQTYFGTQFGWDFYVANASGGGSNIHFGVTGGYIQVNSRDRTPAGTYANPNIPVGFYGSAFYDGSFSTPAGEFRQTSDVPFVGGYATFTSGKFFVDALARIDFYNNKLSDPLNGLNSTPLDATGYSLASTAGYTVSLGEGWFVEPGAGVLISRVSVGNLSVPGAFDPLGTAPAQGNVTVNNIDSLLGRVSLTVGVNFTLGGIAWQPFVTAGAVHEFAGAVSATSFIPPSICGAPGPCIAQNPLSSQISRIGTYGQFSVGTAYVVGDTGWIGYLKGDYKSGENIEAYSGTVGLRYQF